METRKNTVLDIFVIVLLIVGIGLILNGGFLQGMFVFLIATYVALRLALNN